MRSDDITSFAFLGDFRVFALVTYPLRPLFPPLVMPVSLLSPSMSQRLLLLLALILPTLTKTVTWTGNGDGYWFNSTNWSPQNVPESTGASSPAL